MSGEFTTIRTVGATIPSDLLARVVGGDRDLTGLTATDYHLGGGETPREAANSAWSYLTGVWTAFRARNPEPSIGVTRERWLLQLVRQLDYGRVPTTPAGGLTAGDRSFPISHLWERVPLHLLGWTIDLDKRTKGVPGAAERAPHAMLQEFLNRSDDHLWGIVSNGRILRLLRDSTSLSGQSFVEFDLEAMFDGEVFSDFAVLYLLLHESRLEVEPDTPATECWLEKWRTSAIESGTRAMGLLRDGVRTAIEALGTGFLQHPQNADLRARIDSGELQLDDYHHALLRLVYRLIFLFVAEDRGALLDPAADPITRSRYAAYFSTDRLRNLALRRHGTRHGDLWQVLSLVLDALGRETGRPELGLPGIGGLFDKGPADVVTGLSLANDALLEAIRQLSIVQPKGQPRRRVDYRNLDSEELGSIYESLLELVPRHNPAERRFTLESLAGNDRKTSGSYYTPTSLIDLVLDEALDPLLDDAEKSDNAEAALLALTVCDPACGSGHFLVAAARRMADRLAVVRTGDVDPTPADLQTAVHDVVSRCIYGVDVNPMAAELAKVSLWIEALQPGRPLTFLDSHIKVGNSLLGTSPELLASGIPDGAFDPIEGDDRKYASALKKRNRLERDREQQDALFDSLEAEDLHRRTHPPKAAAPATLAELHVAEQRYREYENSPELRRARLLANAWCAAFVQRKVAGAPRITQETLDAGTMPEDVVAEIDALWQRYRFFHIHLEFPDIFEAGGFSAVVGNPPWERVKLQEQEFFASRDEPIANAKNSAARKKLIKMLSGALAEEWATARRHSEGVSHLLRDSGRYPLCGVGDVNTYSVFAEHMRSIIAPTGRMGVITPTGLATEATTAPFFADSLRDRRVAAFYDFENEAKIFPAVTNRARFAMSSLTGGEPVDEARLAFVVRHVADVPTRRFDLAADEILLLNPNTGTLPLFRGRTDAEITLGIYRRHSVLVHDGDPDGNPWHLRFGILFHMANDSELFKTADEVQAAGAQFDGWAWSDGSTSWLPLYEAKLLGHFDHRFATNDGATQAQLNKGTLPHITNEQHDDDDVEALARYWVADPEVQHAIGDRWDRAWFLGWRDIVRASDARTFVPSVLPRSAVGHVFPCAFPTVAENAPLLQATWSSFIFDYVARQKLSGTHMTYGVVMQLACPAPATFDETTAWAGVALREWILPRVIELSYTSRRIAAYARDLGDDGPPFRWIPERREAIRAELDAAMFHVYGLTRPEVEHVLDSFFVVRKYEERDHGEFRTKRLVLEIYDAMAAGKPYRTVLDPAPGHGPRHDRK